MVGWGEEAVLGWNMHADVPVRLLTKVRVNVNGTQIATTSPNSFAVMFPVMHVITGAIRP